MSVMKRESKWQERLRRGLSRTEWQAWRLISSESSGHTDADDLGVVA